MMVSPRLHGSDFQSTDAMSFIIARLYNITSDFWLKNPSPPQPNPTGTIDFLEYRVACVLIQDIISKILAKSVQRLRQRKGVSPLGEN